jgi:nucleotide-binding universal stress UspA family protein
MIPSNILVAVDFSPCSEYALDYACALAAKLGATINLFNAIGASLPELSVGLTDQMMESLRRSNLSTLETLASPRRANTNIAALLVEPGDAREGILRAAGATNADLIVMGTHGRRGVARVLLGSVAESVLRRASCPVLTVRLPTE